MKFRHTALLLITLALPATSGAVPETTQSGYVQPKALSAKTKRGLAWLVENQLPSGAWGQGEESRHMGRAGQMKSRPNVADSAMALLALLRSGSSERTGPYRASIQRGLNYILSEVEAADKNSIYVTKVRGTRVQGKIGPAVDTFLSSLVLAEAKGKMANAAAEQRVDRALKKVLNKIQRNQREDGSFDGVAWAPVLSQVIGSRGVNAAKKKGFVVDEAMREKFERYAQSQMGREGDFRSGKAAGIPLYESAAGVGGLSSSAEANAVEKPRLQRDSKSKDRRVAEEAQAKLRRYRKVDEDKDLATRRLIGRLDDAGFVSGFGNNGGEEFLSYMLVSETLVAKGGSEWREWDKAMTDNLSRVQNTDGSWTGHHCITGRTFVTSAALLVLMADRLEKPVAARIKQG